VRKQRGVSASDFHTLRCLAGLQSERSCDMPQAAPPGYLPRKTQPAPAAQPPTEGYLPRRTEPSPATTLPGGWKEILDAASGNVFYYKAGTGETSWVKPVEATWSLKQVRNLGAAPPLDILQQRTQVLSTKEGGSWTSVARVVEALNNGVIIVSGGHCVIYSANKRSYHILWRSDKKEDMESVLPMRSHKQKGTESVLVAM